MPQQPSASGSSGSSDSPRSGRGLSILLMFACIVVVAAGVRSASSIITPILAAAFISMLAILPLSLLQRRLRLPRWLALLVVLGATIVVTLGTGYYLGQSVASISPELPVYERQLKTLVLDALNAAKERGLDIEPEKIIASITDWKLADFADIIFRSLATVLQNFFFVLLVSAFIIAEASAFPEKMAAAFPNATRAGAFGGVSEKIRSFLVVITQLNLAQAIVNYIACISLGVPFAFLLSFVVFFFNYIPTLGAIIASGAVVAITLVTKGWTAAIIMGAVQVAAGVVFGSIMQPKMLGDRLGLSPLVVLLSLVVWGYLLGVAGMFFAVPLTIIVKIVLDSTDDLRWLSVLLGDASGLKRAPVARDGADAAA
ncbi:MAG: AI-2E family transporter [Phycisphaerales bacterium]